MSERQIIASYRSHIINFMILPLIGSSIVFLAIIPFLDGSVSSFGTGTWAYIIITAGIGLALIISPFKYKLHLTPQGIVHSGILGEKEQKFDGAVQIGNIEQRLMNGAPIAINKVDLLRADGSTMTLKLRKIGLNQSKEIITYIQQNLPFE